MIDFYFIIHYVVYQFLRKREDFSDSLFKACSIHLILSEAFIMLICNLFCRLLGITYFINKPLILVYNIAFAVFEYFVFYRKKRYLEVFEEYAKQSNTPEMQKRLKKAKIFNYSIFAIDLIMLIIIDHLNH